MGKSIQMEFRALSRRPKINSNVTRGVIKSALGTKWLYPQHWMVICPERISLEVNGPDGQLRLGSQVHSRTLTACRCSAICWRDDEQGTA